MKRLAVIGANEPLECFYRQAKEYGLYIVGIAWAEGAVCRKYCDKFYPVSFAEKEKVLEICRNEKIDGITSFSLESALPTVIFVATQMGLVSNSVDCLKLTETKYSQRMAFEKAGIPVPKYQKFRSPDEVDLKSFALPVIVKPVDSGGSQAIYKVDVEADFLHAAGNAVAHSRSGFAIVEEYIDGREFSVEYLSHKGIHYNLQITDKVTSGSPHFIEMQHHQPADIPCEIADRIRCVVEKALSALQISNSPSHTEIKLNSRGELYIIEIGARMGGDMITSDLVRLSTGYDMVKGCVDLALGQFVKPEITQRKYSGVYFYSRLAPDIRDAILSHDKYPEIVEWQLSEGELPEVRSNADRGGYLIYQADSKLSL